MAPDSSDCSLYLIINDFAGKDYCELYALGTCTNGQVPIHTSSPIGIHVAEQIKPQYKAHLLLSKMAFLQAAVSHAIPY
ncbi:hypothetical protein J6590_012389 [Homalodisca vitripennis]|nr:hypothetical protein J6590_012389 [Homalodisca vitripennis]